MQDWIIIKSKTADGTQTEFQVSDGRPGQRSTSYDFLSFREAKACCDELNNSIADKYQAITSDNADYFIQGENEDAN